MKLQRVIAVTFTTLLLCNFTSCGNNSYVDKLNNDIQNGKQEVVDIRTDGMSEDQKNNLREFLISQGLDPDLVDQQSKTEGGATILGSAKPVEEYRTLHDAEEAYGSYFGLHNKLDTLPQYSLVSMYNVNGEFLQGIYSDDDNESTILVKFSKSKTTDFLREPYEIRKFSKLIVVDMTNNVKATIEGDSETAINLMMISFLNGKNYTIYSPTPLTQSQAKDLCKELSNNVTSMQDWK